MIEPLKVDVFSSFFSAMFLRGDGSGVATLLLTIVVQTTLLLLLFDSSLVALGHGDISSVVQVNAYSQLRHAESTMKHETCQAPCMPMLT